MIAGLAARGGLVPEKLSGATAEIGRRRIDLEAGQLCEAIRKALVTFGRENRS